ncbi:pyridoxal phosphate-dependent aminotransferase [Xanthovirga aplysinae]|uniref:pyridoxal phosphate-dependent aminotransferase n=1 Tax=Xanthovirga aplysinae TaxID=2529853 RepID=UPI0012BB9275|nr:aminotransferase class I/II-fold pyridoxal phosphate-dependent enzyme [Xanthovirga aplysinae]MTI32343.1 aminotransferase class I/II-fold pyridoxal phosphate-dependent enzyme [Xanthovirga aplysinae]
MLHGHGDDGYLYEDQKIGKSLINFSSNVSPFGLDEGLKEYLQGKITTIDHYPEPDAHSLSRSLEEFHQNGKVLVTNGATAAFYLIARAFSDRQAVVFAPSFAEYADACLSAGLKVSTLRVPFEQRHFPFKKELLFIGNPNNPDGKLISVQQLLSFAAKNQEALIVVDEAYMDFAEREESVVPFLEDQRNLIVVKSLTKTFSVPGIRLGYILAAPEIIEHLGQKMEPWSVNALALHAGEYILSHFGELLPDYKLLHQWRDEIIGELRKLKILEVLPTCTHYFLLKLKKGKAKELKQFLLHNYAILIRDASNFVGLNEQYIRVSVQSPENNRLLLEGLKVYSSIFEKTESKTFKIID